MRSRAAATVLSRAGFKEVYSMEGGIKAWKGFVAKGVPEAGMAYFLPKSSPEELMALAWLLEDGSQKFYEAISKELEDREAVSLFKGLQADEEKHKESIFQIYRASSGLQENPNFPGSVIAVEPGEAYTEGGMRVNEALEWVKEKGLQDRLELSISLEVDARDLYIKMERKVEDEKAKKMFTVLAEEEKSHLSRLNSVFEKHLGRGQ